MRKRAGREREEGEREREKEREREHKLICIRSVGERLRWGEGEG